MTERLSWFPFFPADFLLDTNVIAMTVAQRGIYITLLAHAWWNGSIPSRSTDICNLVGTDLNDINAPRSDEWWSGPLKACWEPHPTIPNRLVNPRLERERTKQSDLRVQRSDAGRRSADNRLRGQRALNEPVERARGGPLNGKASSRSTNRTEQNRTEQNQKSVSAWPADAAAIWASQIGVRSPAEFGKQLAPAVKQFGWPDIKAALECYCPTAPYRKRDGSIHGDKPGDKPDDAVKNTTFCSPADFVKNLTFWRDRLKPMVST